MPELIQVGAIVEDLLLLTRLDGRRPLGQCPVDITCCANSAGATAYLSGDTESTIIDR